MMMMMMMMMMSKPSAHQRGCTPSSSSSYRPPHLHTPTQADSRDVTIKKRQAVRDATDMTLIQSESDRRVIPVLSL